MIEGLQARGVMAVAKHFPGIGRTTLDSHLVQPELEADPGLLEASDWIPFRAAMRAGVAAVMLSHVRYTRIDPDWPASLSVRIALDLLREKMGFDGVVMTDDLDMKAIHGRYDMPSITRRCTQGEIDMLLVCHQGPDIERAHRALTTLLQTEGDIAEKARTCARRVLALKRRYLGEVGLFG